VPADPHKPLRDDVRLLGELLGETLRARGGATLFDTVERVRALAKGSRSGRGEQFAELAALLADLPVESATPLARAFSHFLSLANVAEQHHRIRRRRAYLTEADARPPEFGSRRRWLGSGDDAEEPAAETPKVKKAGGTLFERMASRGSAKSDDDDDKDPLDIPRFLRSQNNQ